MNKPNYSRLLMASALGVLVFSVVPVHAQSLSIDPYPNGGAPEDSVTAAPASAPRQVSNKDTGVDIGDAPKRLSLDEYEPETLAPILTTDEDSLVVRLPVLRSAPSAPVRPTAPVVVDVTAPLVKREVKVPSEAPPPPKVLSEAAPSVAVAEDASEVVSDAPKVERKVSSTRALLDSVLESSKNLPADRARDVVPSAPAVPEAVLEAAEVAVSDGVVEPVPLPVSDNIVADVSVAEVAPQDVAPEVVAPSVVPSASLPKFYSNADELGIVLNQAQTPISAAVEPVAPLAPIAVMVRQDDTTPIGESMDLIQAQKVPKFAERPIGGVSGTVDPLQAKYLERARVSARTVPVSPLSPAPIVGGASVGVPVPGEVQSAHTARNRLVPTEEPEALIPLNVEASEAVPVSGGGARYASLPPGVQVIRRSDVGSAVSGYDTYRADATREYSATREWKVLQGYELRDILYRWSERAGVRLVWDTSGHYMTQEPLRVESTYEVAVQDLLDQYAGSDNRPTGVIYKDPQTGERYLVIQSAG